MKETMFVSFSGGRTSGYMCHWLLENKADKYDFIFVFANTGQEHEKTLEFVDKCDRHMGLNLVWVEAVAHHGERKGSTYKIVDFGSASMNGAPFEDIISKYGIPNQAFPHCTRETKLNPMKAYKRDIGFSANHSMAVGIRADEIDRMSPTAKQQGIIYPLITMTQATLADVRWFWASQPFDLEVPEHFGNCVTCWKKSDRKLFTLAKHEPSRFRFFSSMENKYGDVGPGDSVKNVFFRQNRSTKDMLEASKRPFVEFSEQMPPLQMGMFDPMDIEEDCGSGCEIA